MTRFLEESRSRDSEVHRFENSNADEIIEVLKRVSSADATERVQRLFLVCEESIGDDDLPDLEGFLSDYHRSVDLSNLELPLNGLTPASGRSLASILSLQHETLEGLSLAHNPFTSDGLQYIIEPLFSHSQNATDLIRLNLTATKLGSKGGLVVAQLLRNNTTLRDLNLANNSIGTKGMKAITPELTFNSSLESLNLSYNNIKAKGATLLANALKDPSSVCNLKSLDLTGNSIGHQGMQTLSQMLARNTTIEFLYAGINNIGPEGAAYLAPAIKINYTLKLVHIPNNLIGPDAASLIFDRLRDDNRTLEDLGLAGNNIGDQGASDLSDVLTQNAVLKNIDLSGNRISSDGVVILAKALRYNLSLVHLDLSNNRIGDRGARALGAALSDPRSETLKTISWEDNPDISEEGSIVLKRSPQIKRNREHWLDKFLRELIKGKIPRSSINWMKRKIGDDEVLLLDEALRDPSLRASPPTIRSLWLGGPIVTSRSLVPLFGTCLSPLSKVVRIYIKNCVSTCEDFTHAIAESLPHSEALEVLSLNGCGITPKGATRIAQGLLHNTTLRRLNLDDNHIGDKGLSELASALPHPTLTSLSANENQITDAGMGSKGLSQIDELHLKKNSITDRGALDFARNLVDGRCRLMLMSLQENKVTKKGGETIQTFLPETIPRTAFVDY